MEQTYKFYEACVKREYDNYRMSAIIHYNAIACGTPADNRSAAKEKSRHWAKFIKNLDWNYLEALAEARVNPKSTLKMFKKLGFDLPKEKT